MHTTKRTQGGFTIIELLVLLVLLAILGALVLLTYSGVQAKNRNAARENAINKLQIQLETYYAETSTYPALRNLNDPAWRGQHLQKITKNELQDPRWHNTAGCTANHAAVASGVAQANCYGYQVVAADGNACDNVKLMCAHYTLTASLEGGGTYVKTSLN